MLGFVGFLVMSNMMIIGYFINKEFIKDCKKRYKKIKNKLNKEESSSSVNSESS